MILCDITNADRFSQLTPALGEVIAWLQAHRNDSFKKGEFTIGSGDNITVKCEEPHLLPMEKSELEAHRRFIDIHVPLKDVETIGWAPVPALKYPHGQYDGDRDVCFYGDSATSLLHVRVGQMAVFFPEDAHAPNIGTGNHRKLCIKIPLCS